MTESYSLPDIYYMDFSHLPASFVERKLKAIANRYARANRLHIHESLQAVAEHYGFKNWQDLRQNLCSNQYEEVELEEAAMC